MQGIKSLETLEEKGAFAEIMADPCRMGLSVKEIADKFSIAVSSIYNRIKDPEIVNLIKEKRAARIKIELPAIDRALMDKALSGDVKAIELVYQRYDEYIPRNSQILEQPCIDLQIFQANGQP